MSTLTIPPAPTSSTLAPSVTSSSVASLSASASPQNLTAIRIDDDSPFLTYSPAWTQGSVCPPESCWASQYVSASEAYNRTWHDATFVNGVELSEADAVPQAQLIFNGSTIAVYGITGLFSTHVAFYLDGRILDAFDVDFIPSIVNGSVVQPDPTTIMNTMNYGTAFLPPTKLEPGEHMLSVMPNVTAGAQGERNVVLLDSVVYSPLQEEKRVGNTTITMDVTPAPTAPSISPTSKSNASGGMPASMMHLSIVLGAVGGVAFISLILLIACILIRRHRRRPPSERYRGKHILVPLNDTLDDAEDPKAAMTSYDYPSANPATTAVPAVMCNDPWDSAPPPGFGADLKSRFSVTTRADSGRRPNRKGKRKWFGGGGGKASGATGEDPIASPAKQKAEEWGRLVVNNGSAATMRTTERRYDDTSVGVPVRTAPVRYHDEEQDEVGETQRLRENIAAIEAHLDTLPPTARDPATGRRRGYLPVPTDLLSMLVEPPQTPGASAGSRRHTMRTMRTFVSELQSTPSRTPARQDSADTMPGTIATQGSFGTIATVNQSPDELRARVRELKYELVRLYGISAVSLISTEDGASAASHRSGGPLADLILEDDEGVAVDPGDAHPPEYLTPPPGHTFGLASPVVRETSAQPRALPPVPETSAISNSAITSSEKSVSVVVSPPASARLAQFRLVVRDDTFDLQPVSDSGDSGRGQLKHQDELPISPPGLDGFGGADTVGGSSRVTSQLPSPPWNNLNGGQQQQAAMQPMMFPVTRTEINWLSTTRRRQDSNDTVQTGDSWRIPSGNHGQGHEHAPGPSVPTRGGTVETVPDEGWDQVVDSLGKRGSVIVKGYERRVMQAETRSIEENFATVPKTDSHHVNFLDFRT